MYDVIVVGARCGGAPLAMLLARKGHKVLLLDRTPIGSDVMSTHYLKRSGASLMQQWGLLDELRTSGTPAISDLTFNIDSLLLKGRAPGVGGVDQDFTPRRTVLDPILVRGAVAAGVEVRDEFTVKGLLFDDNRVCGIKGTTKNGSEVEEHAQVVVGADGTYSVVGKSVDAKLQVDAGTHTCGYYAYYSGLRENDSSASLNILTDERRFCISFPTNDELDMLFLFWPTEESKEVRKDLPAAFDQSLKLVPHLEQRVQNAKRETRIVGTHLLPNFFRQAHGPGWALVGDAALHRDPITAQGITNAFTHADILADELNRGLKGEKPIDQALADYDQRQFTLLKPMFDYTVHLSMLQPLPEEVAQMLPLIQNDKDAIGGFLGSFLGSVPLDQVFPPHLLERFAADVERGTPELKHVA